MAPRGDHGDVMWQGKACPGQQDINITRRETGGD